MNDLADDRALDLPPNSNTNKPAVESSKPLPRFRIRETTVKRRIYDGQTLMLGALHPSDSAKQSKTQPNRQDSDLLIFVTATLITPTGNPIHSADTFPPAAEGFLLNRPAQENRHRGRIKDNPD